MYTYFLKITSRTEETENVCSWTYFLKNNQVREFVKLMISSTSCTQVRDLPKPQCYYILNNDIVVAQLL